MDNKEFQQATKAVEEKENISQEEPLKDVGNTLQQVNEALERQENILKKNDELFEEKENGSQPIYEALKDRENILQRGCEALKKLENTSQQVQEKENRLQQLRETNNARPSNLNGAALQSKKRSKLPAIAASTLAIAGGAAGVGIAAYLKMLAVGVVVLVCCLIVAAVIYYCNIPSSSLESGNTINAADEQLVVQR